MFLGIDMHALSEPALASALEVLAAKGVNVFLQRGLGYTPTPVISHSILKYNHRRTSGCPDGVLITPSYNTPEDGGFKYNPPGGGPAGPDNTAAIEPRANELLRGKLRGVRRMPFEKALKAGTTHENDFMAPYVSDVKNVVEMDIIARSGLKIGADPLGGSVLPYWNPI